MDGIQHEECSRQRIVSAARQLFSCKGFHQTAMSELAIQAKVSVGQVYRLFAGKNDIITAIVREDTAHKLENMLAICRQVEAGILDIVVAFEQLALYTLTKGNEALSFEILSEAHRNPSVAETISRLCDRYRGIVRQLALTAEPALDATALEAAQELVLALLFGLGHRELSGPKLSAAAIAGYTARMILGALAALAHAAPQQERAHEHEHEHERQAS